MLWIPITVGAAGLQVARNALQRGLLEGAGPWAATLVRFLFGLPFSAVFAGAALAVTAGVRLDFSPRFWIACIAGGAAQIGATAAMLVSMRRSSFALGTVFQQSSIPLAALFGLALGEGLAPARWAGVILAAAGLAALGWRRGAAAGPGGWSAALLGLAAGAGFAISANGYRQCALALDAAHPAAAALVTVFIVQGLQAGALTAWLALRDRSALALVVMNWRASLAAGFFGAAASALWFTAVALEPAAPVRAVGVVEAPIAALAARRLFAERLTRFQIAAAAVAAAGVVLAAVG